MKRGEGGFGAMRDSRLMIVAAAAAFGMACGGGSQPAAPAAAPASAPAAAASEKKPAPAEPAASAEPPSAAEHGGVPKDPNERAETPHGGSMVALADKSMQLEVVFDPSSGTLGVYLYGPDGHTPLKLKTAGLQASVTPDGSGAMVQAVLGAVADPAAGNTAGESSHFDATVARLKGVARFNAVIRGLPEGSEVAFSYPM
jgi:hypothetical protein